MTPYYDDGQITIYHADCRDVLPLLPLVDCVITDPPYGVDVAAWDRAVPYDVLPTFLESASGAVTWFGASAMLQTDLEQFKVKPERVLIWAPTFTLSHTQANGLSYRWHPIYTWRIPKKHDGPTWDLLTTPTECGNWWRHDCTKPLNLMRQLVGFAPSNGLILDPFMGSGTTLRASLDTARRAIGIDISEENCEIAVKRLQQTVLPLEFAS